MEVPNAIHWRIHLSSPPEKVYALLATEAGRARFWAEAAPESEGHIDFRFPGGLSWQGKILAARPPNIFQVVYYGGSVTTFTLTEDGSGGTDLDLTDEDVPAGDHCEVLAGWVSVLMALKASVDFSVDLRNHDPGRTWQQGYADN